MLIIQDTEHEYQGETLNMSLLGVVNVPSALERYGSATVFHFMQEQHPAKRGNADHLRPCMVKTITEENGKKFVFAIFVATKEANPQSDRHLSTEEDLTQFRSKALVLDYDENWHSWEDVVNAQH